MFQVKEDPPVSDAKVKAGGWLKTVLGGVAGLLSGGAVMYLSPLVDRVVKPQKPLANFAAEVNGLQVTLHNRSTGGEGWWDFGDGSALEPATASGESVKYAYAKPGAYTVKLTLRNFFGDESERAVQVEVNGAGTAPPAIVDLKAVPVSPQPIAPATFKLVGLAKNADVAVWDVGERMEIVKESPNQQERLVTFAKPGRHVVQFAVLNGAASEKRSVAVDVRPAPANALMAVVRVTDSGTKVEQRTRTENIPLTPEPQARPFERALTTWRGFRIVEAKLATTPAGVKNVKVQPSADRSTALITGELLPAAAKPGQSKPPLVVLPVALRVEKQTPETRKPVDGSAVLSVPGTTTLPLAALPADWQNARRQVSVELRDGGQRMLAAAPLPCTAPFAWQGRHYQVRAEQVGEQVRITVQETRAPAGQVRN
jgi:hypothetical protein